MLAAALALLLSAPPEPAAAKDPGMILSGTVTNAAGAPVAATVTAISSLDPAAAVTGESNADGAFTLPGAARGRTTLHAVTPDGRAGWGFVMVIGAAETMHGAAVSVGPVGSVSLAVAAPDDSPAAGARCTGMNWTHEGERTFLTPAVAAAAGVRWEPAGPDGTLTLPGLPVGAEVMVEIGRPDSYRKEFGPFVVPSNPTAGVPEVRLETGGRVEIELARVEGGGPLPTDGYELRARGGGPNGLMIVDEPWPATADGDGDVTLFVRLPPGDAFVMVTHPDFAPVPRYHESITVAAGETARVVSPMLPRAELTGRVIDAGTGEPLPLATVLVYTETSGTEDDGGFGPGWVMTGADYELDDDGRFSVRAGVGEVRLLTRQHPVHGSSLVPGRSAPLTLTAAGANAGTLALSSLPTLTGTVVGSDGELVPHALIGPGPSLRYHVQTARADAAGRFELPIERVPPDAFGPDGDEPFAADLFAFDPRRARSAELAVTLAPGKVPDPLRIELVEGPIPVPPEPVDGWREYAEPATPAPGDLAPEVQFTAAFNPDGTPLPDPPTLASLRGRWVLLDLRTTWCAPCRTEEPTLAAVAGAYADRLTILEIYGRSDTVPAVRTYLADRPAAGPVLRDTDGGATHAAYGVRGVPTRALIDPAGRVAWHSDYAGGGELRPRLAATVRAFLAEEDGADPAAGGY